MPPLLRIGQFQSCKGGSIGHGVMRLMNSACAAEHSAEEGKPPARQRRMAQSIGYAVAGAGADMASPTAATEVCKRFLMLIPSTVLI